MCFVMLEYNTPVPIDGKYMEMYYNSISACPSGFYGKNCTLKCGACENVACHQNGTCVTGCEEGWKGDSCIERKIINTVMKVNLFLIEI